MMMRVHMGTFHFGRRILFALVVFLLCIARPVFAGNLAMVSDTISDSAPSGTSTSHVVEFTVGTTIPVSGKIIITPEQTGGFPFTIPATLDFTDIDVATAVLPGAFTDRTLAAVASPADDGVSVISGVSGSITITLASAGATIPVGTTVRVTIGSRAVFQTTGDQWITNPSNAGSYHIRLQTQNAVSTMLDEGSTLVVFIPRVTVDANIPIVEPVRSNGLPSGLLPGSTLSVQVSLNTSIPATCRYATTSGITYASMLATTTFTTANFDTLHYRNENVATNTIYQFYVRCESTNFIVNTTDYLITFEVGVVPSASSTPPPPPLPPPPPPAPSGPSGGGGGGGGLFLKQGEVTLAGLTIPFATLYITQDGKIVKQEQISVVASFTDVFQGLDRGTYNWGVYAVDPNGRKTTTYVSTIYLIGGTNNIIAPIYISPTITAASSTVAMGDNIVLSGYGIPLTTVQALMNKQGDALTGKIVTGTTTSNGNGSWTMKLSTDGLTKGTYEVKVQSLLSSKDQSNLSPTLYIGVGENPNPDFRNRSDLNRDGKVNLVDFSILLFNWRTSDAVADINLDGNVNLTDFSIMLANWTG